MSKRADELEFLRWFYANANFGPASEDVFYIMHDQFREETDQELPEGYGEA